MKRAFPLFSLSSPLPPPPFSPCTSSPPFFPVNALSFVAQAAPVDSAATTTTSHSSRVVFRYQSLTSSSASSTTTALSSSTSVPPTFYLAPTSTSSSSVPSTTSSLVATSSSAASSGFSTSLRTRSTVSRTTGTAAATPLSTVAPTVYTGNLCYTSYSDRNWWALFDEEVFLKDACLDASGALAAVEASSNDYVWLSREFYLAHGGLQKLCGKTATVTRTTATETVTKDFVVTGGCGGTVCAGDGVALDWRTRQDFKADPPFIVSFSLST